MNVSNGELPSRAWIAWPGSREEEETILYVGRAEHNGGMFPGTLIPHKGVAHIAWGGHTVEKKSYQVGLKIFVVLGFFHWMFLSVHFNLLREAVIQVTR